MHFEMTMLIAVFMLPAGLAVLVKGADFLVDGSVGLAERMGVSPMVIGLTIVAMGTSAPEVASSIALALKASGDGAVGNVYGSNIANLMLIGGVCAVIRPILVKPDVIKREMPIMVAAALLLYPVLKNMHLGRVESFLLLIIFTGTLYYTVVSGIKESKSKALADSDLQADAGKKQHSGRSLPVDTTFVVLGLICLALGAKMTVDSSVFLGRKAGLSEAVIGLTIIAIGTSLPELMTCVVAALKGHDDLSIGNLVGSNIFNTLLVVGAAGVVRPFDIVDKGLVGFDYWVMITFSAVFVAAAFVHKKIDRRWGTLFACAYFFYLFGKLLINRT